MHFLSKLILSSLALATTATAGLSAGQAFPHPSECGVTGKVPATRGKVVLYDFWGSWCGPCRKSFPAYDAIYQKYRDRGFMVVAIGIDKTAEPAEKFLAKLPHSFPVCFDRGQKMVAKVGPPGMPTAYLVGKDGRIISVHEGFHGKKSVDELEAAIHTALSR